MQLPFIIILVSCFTNLLAFAQAGNETDRLALLDFKSKVTDDPLGILTSWNESIHFCQWHGVTCSADRVTMLDLHSQSLAGSISPHIGNLSFLTVLQLYNNSFTDEIPPEIGSLQRLQILRLHNNSITGQIPVNISACSSLVRINFAINMPVGNIPVQLGLLSNLQALYLDKNNFTGEHGMGCEVSTYGDVYSYGILLLEMFTGKKPTHEMFKDNLSLHNFAKMAMPRTVEEIADPILLEQGETSTNTDDTHSQNHVSRETIRKCLISIFKIGISCSVESPRERMDMSDVVVELHLIRNILVGMHGGRRSANTFAL